MAWFCSPNEFSSTNCVHLFAPNCSNLLISSCRSFLLGIERANRQRLQLILLYNLIHNCCCCTNPFLKDTIYNRGVSASPVVLVSEIKPFARQILVVIFLITCVTFQSNKLRRCWFYEKINIPATYVYISLCALKTWEKKTFIVLAE